MDELKMSSISYESDRPVVSDPKCEAVIKSDGNRNENKNVNFLRFMEELDAQIARFQHRRWFDKLYPIQQQQSSATS